MTTPKRGTSIERDNPFRPGGDIEKEVDIILRSSTISADRVTIVDPSSPQYKKSNGVTDMTDVVDGDGESQHDDSEQVVVSVNSPETTDSNDNLKGDKLMSETGINRHIVPDSNGEKLDPVKTKKKKKKDKSKKTCQII